MHDTLSYFQKDPVYRRFHHHTLTFSLMYAFSENFVLPLSHDEVVHGKRSLLDKMPGDRWQKFANLRALYAYMWAHPGKKLLFMGGELGEWEEWNESGSLHWNLLEYAEHEGIQSLVRDLNRVYRDDARAVGARLRAGRLPLARGERRREQRRSRSRGSASGDAPPLVCVLNLSPVPRYDYRVGMPAVLPLARGAQHRLRVLRRQRRRQPRRRRGRGRCRGTTSRSRRSLTLPPLGAVWLVPE